MRRCNIDARSNGRNCNPNKITRPYGIGRLLGADGVPPPAFHGVAGARRGEALIAELRSVTDPTPPLTHGPDISGNSARTSSGVVTAFPIRWVHQTHLHLT